MGHTVAATLLYFSRSLQLNLSMLYRGVYPPTTKALFPQLPPFSSLPSPITWSFPPLPSIPLLPQSGPLETSLGIWGSAVSSPVCLGKSPSRHRFWCILRGKNSIVIWISVYWKFLDNVRCLNFHAWAPSCMYTLTELNYLLFLYPPLLFPALMSIGGVHCRLQLLWWRRPCLSGVQWRRRSVA